jgi:CRISPR-associated protein Cas2
VSLSAYRFMWIIAMFDLPTETAEARRRYTRFRNILLKDGFVMMQYSVYVRHCASRENAEVHIERVEKALPSAGEVRVLTVTDKQYERMLVFYGKRHKPAQEPPAQLEFF